MADCVVTGTLKDGHGAVLAGTRLTCTPINVAGQLISDAAVYSSISDAAGLITVTLIQGGRYSIKGNALGFTSGMSITIPGSPTATLESFVAGESYTIEGLTIHGPSGPLSGLYQTLKLLGAGVSVVQESPGVASATFTGGGGGGGTWGSITGTLSNQTDLQTALDAKQNSLGFTPENAASKNQNSGYAGLDSSGKINPSQLPAIAISSFLGSVASQAAMLALTGQEGDWAIRTDTGTTWVIIGSDPTQLSSWQQLATPTDLVSSVFGRTGAVTAQANDYTWAQVDKTTSSLADITTRSAADLSSGILPLARLSGITNTEISGSAAIAYSKLSLTGAILNADLAGSIALSKLSISGTPDGTKFLRDDGSWAAAGSSGASTALDNLAAVAINTDLLPASTQKLGSATKPFFESYIGNTTQYESLVQSAGLLTHAALGSATNIGFTFTPKGSGGLTLTTGQLLVPAGSMSAPSLAVGGLGRGLYNRFSNAISFSCGSALVAEVAATGIDIEAGMTFGWGIGGPNPAIGRAAAAVVEITNGSAGGLGKLLYGRVVTAKTSDYTVLAADKNTFFTNVGAAGTVNFTLPTAAAGLTYEFYRDANQTLRITAAASTTIRVGTSVTAAAGNVTLDAVGSRIRLVAISTTQWVGDVTGAATFT